MTSYRGVRRVSVYEIRYTENEGWVGLVELSWHQTGDSVFARHYTDQRIEIYGESKEVVEERVEWLLGAIRSYTRKEA